ncbi:MAG: hypothetical protein IPJ25_06400 [Rhodocyclaceae bacterium]|nr:hypothetical protein [Rhodocyclaceae bacterium]
MKSNPTIDLVRFVCRCAMKPRSARHLHVGRPGEQPMVIEVLLLLLVFLAFLNAWATLGIFKDQTFSRGQRTAQIAFVWLVPLLGALLAFAIKDAEPKTSTGRYSEEPEPPDDDIEISHKYFTRDEQATERDSPSVGEVADGD